MSDVRQALEGAPKADFVNIPLPPEEAAAEIAAPAREAPAPPLVAVLDFLEPEAVRKETPFRFPFRLDGREVRSFVARRLLLVEVGGLVARAQSQGDIDPIEFYAVMTGLPAPVIRGLEADDGELLVETCYPFLPRIAQAAISLLTPASGAASA
ncbi:hypothetical protein [Methylosinus sp. Sm6]|uniref:hypothetical protein n=1 Tax=Methylosinus sp. Sm6 TaxID=2866948 RepID=UPI001C99D132|nr:hypothetical protein [Methylosinus sp. Sm6]MBY6244029.1 hypothetical protein [Methylosinus sp. Sm6]